MLNAILHLGPAYDTSGLVGFPINVLFVYLMQNQNGRTLFANEDVNLALKDVLNDYGKMLNSSTSLTFMNKKSPKGWLSP
jgi:phosphatidylserine decarboxylase